MSPPISTAAPIVQLAGITKTFPGPVVANDDVSLAVYEGEIHALIGENGAGKSTLAGILYGRFQPDSGRIRLAGEDVRIASPAAAIARGIGMVSQHTTLIPALTTLENVILGAEPGAAGIIDRSEAQRRVREAADRLGIALDWGAPAGTLSVASQQKAEIVKALYRGARILVLDEPTSALAPQEAGALFDLLETLAATRVTILFITHKLREVMDHSHRITVLRGGRVAGDRLTAETWPEDLLALMLGRKTSAPGLPLAAPSEPDAIHEAAWERGAHSELRAPPPAVQAAAQVPTLEVRSVIALNDRRAPAVRSVSLSVAPGEVVGIAGVDGSGQRELAEAIVGLRSLTGGSIWLDGRDVTRLPVDARRRAGISYIPEDRHREGLVLDFSIAENLILGRERDPRAGGGVLLNLPAIRANGDRAVAVRRIRAGGGDVPASSLSGGNQQKVVIARALAGEPRLLVAMQPTRGLDVEAARFVYESIRAAAAAGLAALLFSLDLDEIFEIAARVLVMYNGEIAGDLERDQASPDRVGRLMLEGRA